MSNGLQVTDDFNDFSNVDITYNGDATIDTVVLSKFIEGHGLRTKTYTFTYNAAKVATIRVVMEDVPILV